MISTSFKKAHCADYTHVETKRKTYALVFRQTGDDDEAVKLETSAKAIRRKQL